MTKFEAKEIQKLETMHSIGGYETNIALGLSSLVRCARTTKSRNELINLAMNYFYVAKHPEFRI